MDRQDGIRVLNSYPPPPSLQDDEIDRQKAIEWLLIHTFDKAPKDEEISGKTSEIRSLIYNKQFEKALQVSEQLTKDAPKWSASWISLGNVLWFMSKEGRDKGVLREAKKAYFEGCKICRRDPFVLRGLGKVAYAEGNFSYAQELFERAEKTMVLLDERFFIDKDDVTTLEWIEKCKAQASDPNDNINTWIKA